MSSLVQELEKDGKREKAFEAFFNEHQVQIP